jgi:hypothetical protein
MRFSVIDMRSLLLLILLILPSIAAGQEPPARQPRIADPVKFDEWGDLPFTDEAARLDNAAIQLRNQPGFILYLVLHAAKRSCVGEARSRGVRAKNYLVRYRHVNPRQVVWIDAGYRDYFVTDVWIWPPNMQPPAKMHEDMVSPNQLRLDRHCRIKCRACASEKRRA